MANPNSTTTLMFLPSKPIEQNGISPTNTPPPPPPPLHQSQENVLNGPVAILWDIENCPVPSDVRSEDVGGNIRMALRLHPVVKGAVNLFSAYGDFNAFPRRLREGCQRTGVKLVDVPNGRKDAADKAILVDMFLFALDNRPPSTIMLISGDVDFAPALHILGQRGYTVILVIPSGVGVSSALCNAGRFVWDWPSVARGEGFLPASSKPSFPSLRRGGSDVAGYLMGHQTSDGQNEEEAIVYRGASQGYFPRAQSLNETGDGMWVQPGDLDGLRKQMVKLLELSGGGVPMNRLPAEYQKLYGRPLYVSEYGVCKLMDLVNKMDSVDISGKGPKRFVYLRNSRTSPSAPPLYLLTKKDEKGKGMQEDNIIQGGASSDELSDEDRFVVEEEEACEVDDDRNLEEFKRELQEILVSYSCGIFLGCFEAIYLQRYKRPLDYHKFGVNQLEDLLHKVRDIVTLQKEEGSERKFLLAFGCSNSY
ncbi:uncharacterized protein LOC124944633 [Impatiens glandulifera]|uniref:uncharacterized protein LOC124944633 n=1 Tax=Impatiens glandulifera TaxID=253017 RepID=UPI001FB185ED|nr:uncharacterized protein LOC124944633 [Impatiens glandulifera]